MVEIHGFNKLAILIVNIRRDTTIQIYALWNIFLRLGVVRMILEIQIFLKTSLLKG
jgi:hypothetical protein